jgi:hypothetical protein
LFAYPCISNVSEQGFFNVTVMTLLLLVHSPSLAWAVFVLTRLFPECSLPLTLLDLPSGGLTREPELVLIFGKVVTLAGFPPWLLRNSEIV